jgi:hypothetical protein
MFQRMVLLIVMVALVSCKQEKEEPPKQVNMDSVVVDTVAVFNNPRNNMSTQTDIFSEIDSSGILLFPLSMGEPSRQEGSFSYKKASNNSYWNIIFLNSHTNEYHLLGDGKILINSFDFQPSTHDSAVNGKYIFYSIVKDDYNSDGELTGEDPSYLFISDKKGNNLRQISPANCHVQHWYFIKSVNKLLLIVKKDSDNNKKFDNADEVTTFEVEIDKGTAAKQVFSTPFKNKLKLLYERDWKQMKQ